MQTKSCDSYTVRIYIAGCYSIIEQACNDFVKEHSLCVGLRKNKYIYTGGCEQGAIIELINYPRFEKNAAEIDTIAADLGKFVMDKANQKSFSIANPFKTTWYTAEKNSVDHG